MLNTLSTAFFLFLHGSPGSPQDFAGLQRALGVLRGSAPARAGYVALGEETTESSLNLDSENEVVIVGYSWGCVSALRWAEKLGSRTKAVVLISPYLFLSQNLSPFKSALLRTPFLGQWLVKSHAQKAVDALLEESSRPAPVPPAYREAAERYRDPRALKTAVLEKNVSPEAITVSLDHLRGSGAPVFILWGEMDLTGSPEKAAGDYRRRQIERAATILAPTDLARFLSDSTSAVAHAGHALLWTHPEFLAEEIKKFLNKTDHPAERNAAHE